MRAFIFALLIFGAMLAAVLYTSRPALGQPLARADRVAAMSAQDISNIGAAARMAADGNVAAQVWLDAQLAKVSQ